MKHMCWVGIAVVLLMAVAAGSEAAISVPLAVSERAGVERTAELAGGGVPLPVGLVKDTKSFAVVNSRGEPVPAQFTILSRWPRDGSVRWMLVQFPVSIGARDSQSFKLVQGAPNPRPKYRLSVRDTHDMVIVDTGVLRFTLRKKRFALFDTLTIRGGAGAPRVELGPDLCGDGFTIKPVSGGVYTTAAGDEATVTLEDVGPLRATIRVDGRYRDASGKPLFLYRVRIYATAGSRAVRVQYVFTDDVGDWEDPPVDLKELSLTLKAKFSGPMSAHIGGAGKTYTALLERRAMLRQLASSSSSYVLDGALSDQGASRDANVGWCALSGGKLTMTTALRWFWQLYPKAYTLGGDGSLKVELVPPDAREPAHIYRGMSKTHDLLFVFDNTDAPAQQAAVGFQQPLSVKCPPSWYCQGTLGFGRLVSSDYKGIRPEFAKLVELVDDGFEEQVEYIRKVRNRIVDRQRHIDSYGMIHFGDGFHHFSGTGHRKVQWDNCYYSYTHMLAMQYARTGSDLILDTLREAATFEGDVGIAWLSADIATPRVNPGAYHVGGFSGFHNGPSGSWNFYKPIGMMELFYLTGERRHQDAGLANFNWTLRADGYDIYHNPRSVGAGLRALVHGYLATGNKRFLYIARDVTSKAERFYRVHGHFAPIKNSIFMCPNALEGLCTYHEFIGDQHLGKLLPDIVAAHFQRFGKNPARLDYAYVNLYTARLAGNQELRRQVERALADRPSFSIASGNHSIKDFAAGKRGVPLIFWYLSDLAEAPPNPWGPVDLGPERPDRRQVRPMQAPKLDGELAKREWDKSTVIDLVGNPDPSRKPDAPTRLHLGYDSRNLYLAVEASEPHLDLLKLSVKEDGGRTYVDDCVEIFVGPGSRLFCTKLIVNAAGYRKVGLRGHEKPSHLAPMEADFPVKAGRGKDKWVLEVTIPWAKAGVTKVSPGTEVGFNVVRYRMADGVDKPAESSTWNGTSNQTESIGTLVLSK